MSPDAWLEGEGCLSLKGAPIGNSGTRWRLFHSPIPVSYALAFEGKVVRMC